VTYQLKLNRNAFAFLIAVISAGSVYVGSLPYDPTLKAFVVAVISAAVVYLGTEEQKAPA
jgi:hypothetical protein